MVDTPPPSDTQPIPYTLAVFGVPLTPELIAACQKVRFAYATTTDDCGDIADLVSEVLATVGA